MAGKQLPLDFPRCEQLGILRDAILPPVRTKRGGVSAVLLKAVLKAIDDHGRECFAKQETLAREVGCSPDQIKRAVVALQSLSLICVERKRNARGTVCNHCRIVWSELALLAPSRRRDQSVMVRDQSVMVRDQSVIGDTCIGKRKEAEQEPPTPSAPSVNWEAAEAEILKELTDWQTPLRAAKGSVSPQYVLDVLTYYRSSSGTYGPGALYHRLKRSHPDLRPFEGWPPLKPPTATCQRAIDLLAASRNEPAVSAGKLSEPEFQQVFRNVLRNRGLVKYFEEVLFREKMNNRRQPATAAGTC